MAYGSFDPTKPASGDTGTSVPGEACTNDKALRDAILMGQVQGFTLSVSGGTAQQPAQIFWKNGSIWLRASLTWGTSGGQNYNLTAIAWDLSVNGGTSYDSVGTGETLSYDSSGNLTGAANASGFLTFLLPLLGRVNVASISIAAINATLATLGTMATQNASAVNITGGKVTAQRTRELIRANFGTFNSSVPVDWEAQGVVIATVAGASAAFTYTNLPVGGDGGPAGALLFRITNGGLATNLFGAVKKPGGAALALSSSGTDWVSAICIDGVNVEVFGKAMDIR